MTKLNTVEEYLEEQLDLDNKNTDFRYNCVGQIMRYIKSIGIVPTYGMVFDIEVLLEDHLSRILDIITNNVYPNDIGNLIRDIIKENKGNV